MLLKKFLQNMKESVHLPGLLKDLLCTNKMNMLNISSSRAATSIDTFVRVKYLVSNISSNICCQIVDTSVIGI